MNNFFNDFTERVILVYNLIIDTSFTILFVNRKNFSNFQDIRKFPVSEC